MGGVGGNGSSSRQHDFGLRFAHQALTHSREERFSRPEIRAVLRLGPQGGGSAPVWWLPRVQSRRAEGPKGRGEAALIFRQFGDTPSIFEDPLADLVWYRYLQVGQLTDRLHRCGCAWESHCGREARPAFSERVLRRSLRPLGQKRTRRVTQLPIASLHALAALLEPNVWLLLDCYCQFLAREWVEMKDRMFGG